MAWIMKNSGSMEVERREEPYLTDDMKAKLEADVLTRYPTRQAATLPTLHAVQHKVGYLPHQALEEVADFLGLEPSVVLDTASFYEEFFLSPKGKYTVWVCQSISCELLNNKALVEKISDHLGIQPGETTDDGKITLLNVECLGACGGAPCALVGEKLHENLTPENLVKVVSALE